MSQLIAMIMQADDWVNPEVMHQPMPAIQLEGLEPSHYLGRLEPTVMEVGWATMRTLLAE